MELKNLFPLEQVFSYTCAHHLGQRWKVEFLLADSIAWTGKGSERSKKPAWKKLRQWLRWTVSILFNTSVQISSLYIMISEFSVAGVELKEQQQHKPTCATFFFDTAPWWEYTAATCKLMVCKALCRTKLQAGLMLHSRDEMEADGPLFASSNYSAIISLHVASPIIICCYDYELLYTV